MIILGKYFSTHAPKKINKLVGYRTPRSMKSKATWEFAHHYFGKLWFVVGWITLLISAIILIMLIGQDEDTIGIIGGTLSFVQCIPLIGCIYPTEKALRENFDKDGNPLNRN